MLVQMYRIYRPKEVPLPLTCSVVKSIEHAWSKGLSHWNCSTLSILQRAFWPTPALGMHSGLLPNSWGPWTLPTSSIAFYKTSLRAYLWQKSTQSSTPPSSSHCQIWHSLGTPEFSLYHTLVVYICPHFYTITNYSWAVAGAHWIRLFIRAEILSPNLSTDSPSRILPYYLAH